METVDCLYRPDTGFSFFSSRIRANAPFTSQVYNCGSAVKRSFKKQSPNLSHLRIQSLSCHHAFSLRGYTMRPYIPDLFALIYTIASVLTRPYDSAALQPRSINCTDPRAPTDSSCWQALNLTAWLTNRNQTTPTCKESQDGADCCLVGEAWNRCFLRLAHGCSGSNCTQINAQACTWDQSLAVIWDFAAQIFYVMTTIECKFMLLLTGTTFIKNEILICGME